MHQAAQSLLGTHDFATFGAPTVGTSTVRHMVKVQCRLGRHGLHRFIFRANGFLQHMVRGLMGSLVEVGRGKWTVADFQAALQAQDRHACGPLAPPQGLILWRVTYPSSSIERQAEVEPHETQNMDS
jgi:tRNA pseudouridine38-40 synthase